MDYQPPLQDLLFCLAELADFESIAALPAYADAGLDGAGMDTAQAVLDECGRLCSGVLSPLNATGDRQPATWSDGVVTTSPGFRAAFAAFAEGGWQGVSHPSEYGGQGLPKALYACCSEMINGANLSFALCPLLTDGAVEALLAAGTPAQRALYLPKMLAGLWTGTMNLTEPQAGSDLALLRSRAEPQPDGSYRITGTKIYITYGEHDLAENIVHLVLARLPDAPAGVKGISLFLVPKFLPDAAGAIGERNGVRCVSIEHKLGIKASPTAVLSFEGARGELIGAPNRGLEMMFVMMNAARYAVGLQGIGIMERSRQLAVGYARDRIQGRAAGATSPASAEIIQHPDVQRMLMRMRSTTEACRALAVTTAAEFDMAHHHGDPELRRLHLARAELLVPLVKGYCTESSVDIASIGIQVHGGMGYIEETGAAQLMRDARILPIYEGTTAIQANDLVGRKTLRDGGAAVHRLCDEVATTVGELERSDTVEARATGRHLAASLAALREVVAFVLAESAPRPAAVFAGSVPYLMLAATTAAGWQMGRALLIAQAHLATGSGDANFLLAKIATARFYAEHVLSAAPGLRTAIVDGADSVGALALDAY